jgi:hypothetical protein
MRFFYRSPHPKTIAQHVRFNHVHAAIIAEYRKRRKTQKKQEGTSKARQTG